MMASSSGDGSNKYVDHTYRDFSHYIEEGGELIRHKKSHDNFPKRLHKLVSGEHSDVITWMPHGRAWKVLNRERLISEVIGQYYSCKKYESFTRQLNGWGFKRLYSKGPDNGCYYHESFLQGMPELTCLIRRLPGNIGKTTPFPEGEPNFYLISDTYPLPAATLTGCTTSSAEAVSSSNSSAAAKVLHNGMPTFDNMSFTGISALSSDDARRQPSWGTVLGTVAPPFTYPSSSDPYSSQSMYASNNNNAQYADNYNQHNQYSTSSSNTQQQLHPYNAQSSYAAVEAQLYNQRQYSQHMQQQQQYAAATSTAPSEVNMPTSYSDLAGMYDTIRSSGMSTGSTMQPPAIPMKQVSAEPPVYSSPDVASAIAINHKRICIDHPGSDCSLKYTSDCSGEHDESPSSDPYAPIPIPVKGSRNIISDDLSNEETKVRFLGESDLDG